MVEQKSANVLLRIPIKLLNQIDEAAHRGRRSRTAQLLLMLEYAIKKI